MTRLLTLCLLMPALSRAQALPDDNVDDAPLATHAIQERAYRMGLEFALGGGLLPVDPYTKQVYGQGSATIHFSDSIAWQIARAAYGYNWRSGLREQLERDFQALPKDFETVQFFVGSDLMFTPFYGKSAIANRFVVYYEAYILLGGTVFKFDGNGSPFRPGIDIGGGLRVYQNKVLSYRLELLDSLVVLGDVNNILAVTLNLCLNIGFTE